MSTGEVDGTSRGNENMPITKTISGLVLIDELDSIVGWTKDGTGDLSTDTATKHSGIGSQERHITSAQGGGAWKANMPGNSYRIHIWHKLTWQDSTSSGNCYPIAWGVPLSGVVWLDDLNAVSCNGGGYPNHDWMMHRGTLFSDATHTMLLHCLIYQTIPPGYGDSGGPHESWIDRLVISTTKNLTVTGLTPGQKVEVYRSSDDALMGTQTCAGDASSVIFDIDIYDYPLQCYMKVTGTDSATVIDTTPSYEMCGGDTWSWTGPWATITVTSATDIIYRTL
jgi:hypothetical protein